MWEKVTKAILAGDQQTATNEKANLEGAQREAAKKRAEKNITHEPRLFASDGNGGWVYKYFNKQPWNPQVDLEEYEADDGIIYTRKKT